MNFASLQKACKLTLAAFLFCAAGWAPAHGQGLMEYGGLMAMPKGVPSGGLIEGIGKSFGAIPNALPGQAGQAGQAAPVIPPSIAVKRADGTVAVDQKKLAAVTAKAIADQNAAKQLLANSAASPAQLKEAEKHLRDAITVRNSIWGYQDPSIPKLLNQLGNTYERLKQPSMAKSCYQNAVTYINKKYGFGSNERLESMISLAPLLVKEGDLSEALNLQQQIALIKERKSGPASLDTIEARLTWAGTARALDKPNAADLYKQCLTDLDKAGSNISPEQVSKLKGEIFPPYVEALKKQGREEEASEATALMGAAQAAGGQKAATAGGQAAPAAAAPQSSQAAGSAPAATAGQPGTVAASSSAVAPPSSAASPASEGKTTAPQVTPVAPAQPAVK
jgi:tetratricopeptide (TPR) repeat protein